MNEILQNQLAETVQSSCTTAIVDNMFLLQDNKSCDGRDMSLVHTIAGKRRHSLFMAHNNILYHLGKRLKHLSLLGS